MNFFSLFKRKFKFIIKKKINIDSIKIKQKSLDKLFNYFGSDKSFYLGNSKTLAHGYSKFYTKNLDHLRNKKINILEIGSYAGSSAAAFKKYFKNSKIYCFDVNISNFKYYSKDIKVFGLDISDEKKTKKILKNKIIQNNIEFFDIIVDDGSHNLSDMIISFKYLFTYLKKKGFYIIEDFKFPNYFKYNKDIKHILLDKMFTQLKNKKFFISKIIDKKDQRSLLKSIKKIKSYKGNLYYSDICFIKKK